MDRVCHERKLNRLPNYDYSQVGWYFITICTKYMTECFGEIRNDEMVLNECGRIVTQQWLWLEKQYKHVQLDTFIVMPNHFHGVLAIVDTDVCCGRNRSRPVPTPKIQSLSKLMGAFKTTSSKMIHINGETNFAWHRSFHDHIVHNEKELNNIRSYIHNNPMKWATDRNNHLHFYPNKK